ncbi:hypothetical protein ACOACO_05570 [Nocardioides sp. CPCC 205120]|uniref:hypothetical protein n=1 Tax=Nocardioides sp. CPCC 205120 TaxID=3406462 RepID=UPI003B511F50
MLKFVLVVLVVAACIYFALRLLDKRRSAGGSGGRPVPRGPVGPDDDPDFIWNLNKRVRRPGTPPGTPPGTTPNAGDPVDPLDLGPADPLAPGEKEPGTPGEPGDEPPAPDAPAR